MKKFTIIRESKGCIDGVEDRIMDGYVFDGIADYDESKRVDTDGFYDGWDGKICEDENGELYLVDFDLETKEPRIWCKIKEEDTYNRTKIAELDPRQCCYIYVPTSYSDRIELNAENAELALNSEPLYAKIIEAFEIYPNRETYLWDNMRGLTVVFRTDCNESMFAWDELTKISLHNNHIDCEFPAYRPDEAPVFCDDETTSSNDPVIQARCGLLDLGFNDTLVFSMSDYELLSAWEHNDIEQIELAMEHYAQVYNI